MVMGWTNAKIMLGRRLVFAGSVIQSLKRNPFNAGTVFRRQNLTSKDVIFWRLKTAHTLKVLKYF